MFKGMCWGGIELWELWYVAGIEENNNVTIKYIGTDAVKRWIEVVISKFYFKLYFYIFW